MNLDEQQRALQEEIELLEKQLQKQKTRLQDLISTDSRPSTNQRDGHILSQYEGCLTSPASIHALLLLSDSALPLGAFAYSSGLESFLAHRKVGINRPSSSPYDFQAFLHLSVSSIACTNVPYLLAGYRNPTHLQELDNDIDASTPCTVARRASIAQGRALLGVWDRSFRTTWVDRVDGRGDAAEALQDFSRAMKVPSHSTLPVNGHFAPIWGTTSRAMGLDVHQTAYIFLMNHAKAVLSAAVRASVIGPYQAQSLLAGAGVQKVVADCIQHVWSVSPEDAAQVVPALDLWVGRHELLYSRIFNS